MSLIPYTITALEASAVDSATSGKNIVVGAVVTMTDSAGVVTMFDDAAGSNGSTAKATGADGQVTVFVNPNTYTVSVNGSASKVEISEAEFTGTTTDLINSIDAYAADTLINSTGYLASGDGGDGSWKQNGVTGQTPSQSPAQLGNALLNDASGNQWALVGNGINVKQTGATGSRTVDNSAAIQAAINKFKNPDLTDLPGAINFRINAINGGVVDLDGEVYAVSSPLNFDDFTGASFGNGSLLAIGTWDAGLTDALIVGDVTRNSLIHKLTLELNQLCNGILLNRCVYSTVEEVNIFGAGSQLFGFSSQTSFGGMSLHLVRVRIFGTTAAETGANSPLATGFLITGGSDSVMSECITSRMLVGASISTGGWEVTNSHFTGADGINAIGLSLGDGAHYMTVVDNVFDHCHLKLNGSARRTVSDNMFRNDTDDLSEFAILWEATAIDQGFAGTIITDNNVWVRGTVANHDFIRLSEPGSFTWGSPDGCLVHSNTVRTQGALPAGFTSISSTSGSLQAAVSGTEFTGAITTINMAGQLLNGNDLGSALILGGCVAHTSSGSHACERASYSPSTQLLTLEFSSAFTGTVGFYYTWGTQAPILVAAAP